MIKWKALNIRIKCYIIFIHINNDINKPLISNNGRGVSADRMLDYLITNHKQYADNEQGFDNDYSFITSVGYAFVTNYVKLFMINSGKDIVIDMNEDYVALNSNI